MKLTKEQIQLVNDYIHKNGLNYTDVRMELLDHLVSDIEAKSIEDIEEYLKMKKAFINEFYKRKESAIHWSYQKQLWLTFFSFFYKLKMAPITLFIIGTLYISLNYIDNKKLVILSIIVVAILLFYALYINAINSKKIKNLVSFKYLGNILAIPQLFLFTFNLVTDYIISHQILLTIYLSLALGLTVAAVILIKEKKQLILKRFEFLNN